MNSRLAIIDPNPSGTKSVMMCASMPDDQLVARAQEGATEAFNELHRRYQRRMFCTAMKITQNSEDSEDAVQDTFLKAFRHLRSFGGRSSFTTWLTRILINTCLMQRRRRHKCKYISLDDPLSNGLSTRETLVDELISVETAYTQKQRSEMLSQAISRLSPNLRVIVETFHLQDCSIAELAERNHISVAAAKTRIMRARLALKGSYRLRKACEKATSTI